MFNPYHQSSNLHFDAFEQLNGPSAWPVTRSTADPIELRFKAPTAGQLELVAEKFLGRFGEENAAAFFSTAQAGKTLLRTPFNFERWAGESWLIGEREVLNSLSPRRDLRVVDYTIDRAAQDDEPVPEAWRGGSEMAPTVALKRYQKDDAGPVLSLVAGFGEPLPFLDRRTLAQRWTVIDSLFQSECAAPLAGNLSEFVISQTSRAATLRLPGAELAVSLFADSGAHVLLRENSARDFGADRVVQLDEAPHLMQILHSVGVSISSASCEQIVGATRLNAGLRSIDVERLLKVPVPFEIARNRRSLFEDGGRSTESITSLALITRHGDLYVTLKSDSDALKGKISAEFSWDPRTVAFSRPQWERFSALTGGE